MDPEEAKPVEAEVVNPLKIQGSKGEVVRDEKGRWVPGKRPPGSGRTKGTLNKITREQQKMQLTIYKTLNERSEEVAKMPIDKLLAAGVQLTPKDSKLTVDMNGEEKIVFIFPQIKAPHGHQNNE